MKPQISIIIPTYHRAELLSRLLNSLKLQNIPARSIEIIVVSDGPDNKTAELILKCIRSGQENLVHLFLEKRSGPAAARNLGWRYAGAALIAFTDDDCIVQPAWASSFLQAWNNELLIAFTGAVEVPVSKVPTDHEKNTQGLERAEFITANCCLSREALKKCGGFDENFKMAWREDSDMHFKLLEHKIPISRVGNARVIHPVRKAAWGICIKEQRKSMYDALLYKKFPALYRSQISSSPPFLYYTMILAFAGGIRMLIMSQGNFLYLIPWSGMVLYFSCQRLRYTSKSLVHIGEMVITSALIPFLSVYWRLFGALKFKTLFI